MNEQPPDAAHVPISEYLRQHSKPNGGIKSFLHSNLFSALVVVLLGQAILWGISISSSYWKTSQLVEWKGTIDATLKRMDEQGTNHSRWVDEEQEKKINSNNERIKRMEEETSHLDVLEVEHQRLTKDVEKLKNGKK